MRAAGIFLSVACLLAVANAAPIVDQQLFVQNALVSGRENLKRDARPLLLMQGLA